MSECAAETPHGGATRPAGSLHLQVLRGGQAAAGGALWPARELSVPDIRRLGLPRPGLPGEVNRWRAANTRNLWRGVRRVLTARALNLATMYGTLYLTRITAGGDRVDYGLASMRVVTTTGVGYIVDAFQNIVEAESMKFHGIGTGAVAEASGDTALGTELTTAYNPDSTRATGSLTEGASGNIFRTVGTNTVDATAAITEHGILSQAATGGGVLLDRSVFSVINLASGDSLQSTYDLTFPAGG
jgi:hypothetical protein